MTNLLDLLTFEWFLPKALIGLSVGFVLRVLEHYAWLKRENKNERLFFWSIVVLTQSICVGLPVAYVLLAFLIRSFPSIAFITVAAYMLPTLAVFIAVDLRQLLRRIYSKIEH